MECFAYGDAKAWPSGPYTSCINICERQHRVSNIVLRFPPANSVSLKLAEKAAFMLWSVRESKGADARNRPGYKS